MEPDSSQRSPVKRSGKGHKLKYWKFHLIMVKEKLFYFEDGPTLQQVVASPSLKILKTHSDIILISLS